MADNTWYMDIEPKIFSIVKAKTIKNLQKNYPKIRYTTNDENVEPVTVFPTVYIHEISSIPVGNDLEADGVNGVNSTFEVRVTTNTQKTDAKKVMEEISSAFSSLKFTATSLPIYSVNDKMFIYNARFRRIIGANDTI